MTDMKQEVNDRIQRAIVKAFGIEFDPKVKLKGNVYETAVALKLAKQLLIAPLKVANAIEVAIDRGDLISKVEISGCGFINVTLNQ